ncbi:MAG: hypothetical protein ACLQT6_09435 [Desulfomonilaceae bacterium]
MMRRNQAAPSYCKSLRGIFFHLQFGKFKRKKDSSAYTKQSEATNLFDKRFVGDTFELIDMIVKFSNTLPEPAEFPNRASASGA